MKRKISFLIALSASMVFILSGCDKKTTDENISKKDAGTIIQNEEAVIASDSQTHLMWQDQLYNSTNTNDSDEKIGNWKYAKDYCEKLSLKGYDDWRLPSVDELKSIIDKKNKPAFKSIFKNATNKRYWSSSPYMSDPKYAWLVDFDITDSFGGHVNNKNFIRCVRNEK
ncbi:MAG: DUF1566 domain-containing protein [Sulfurovaceae bacterium]|nr:DUF1566 domain-containing protein [Sulfurovaceae bacterium]